MATTRHAREPTRTSLLRSRAMQAHREEICLRHVALVAGMALCGRMCIPQLNKAIRLGARGPSEGRKPDREEATTTDIHVRAVIHSNMLRVLRGGNSPLSIDLF